MPEKHGPDVYFDFSGKSGSVSIIIYIRALRTLAFSRVKCTVHGPILQCSLISSPSLPPESDRNIRNKVQTPWWIYTAKFRP